MRNLGVQGCLGDAAVEEDGPLLPGKEAEQFEVG